MPSWRAAGQLSPPSIRDEATSQYGPSFPSTSPYLLPSAVPPFITPEQTRSYESPARRDIDILASLGNPLQCNDSAWSRRQEAGAVFGPCCGIDRRGGPFVQVPRTAPQQVGNVRPFIGMEKKGEGGRREGGYGEGAIRTFRA
ncbi:hypothetical protein Bbelb_417400 [Branchiostoma belcheri]|nr:hypothetical protein Bbelb_417400 [Branchiostoma belcheri]